MKKLSILGSTGSIGTQTLDIVKNNPNEFKIVALTTNNNIELLKRQTHEFKPLAVAVMDEKKADELRKNTDVDVYSGMGGIIKIATLKEADTVVNSLVGSVGVKPTVDAIKSKKNIALANKETLVAAGSTVMEEVRKNNVNLMPIDSEHSAIFQCLNGEKIEDVEKIIITASGGSFRSCTLEQMGKATVDDALAHPTWKMGNKITIDSATLMNKGFEVIETHWLYGVDYDKIVVAVHPQSIVHSLVEFKDGSVIAQLGNPDMKLPIQYALSYPKRLHLNNKKLELTKIKKLDFEAPDFRKFPCLKLAFEAGKVGGSMGAVLNATNEVAVGGFLNGTVKFLDIPKIIKRIMDSHSLIKNPSLNDILKVDKEVKEETQRIMNKKEFNQ
jgi:1-deoxy-D-xylulose-5-phosphate reductoisomerase